MAGKKMAATRSRGREKLQLSFGRNETLSFFRENPFRDFSGQGTRCMGKSRNILFSVISLPFPPLRALRGKLFFFLKGVNE